MTEQQERSIHDEELEAMRWAALVRPDDPEQIEQAYAADRDAPGFDYAANVGE
jgi:hypothetical protein